MNVEAFMTKLDNLSKGERTALKRECGTMLQRADGAAISAFYRCLPAGTSEKQESRSFAVACIHCLWEEGTGVPIEKLFSFLRMESDTAEKRLAAVTDMPWDEDGLFLAKLVRLIKMAKQKGYQVDTQQLLKDLLNWDSEKRYVQRRWLKTMYINQED